MLSQEILPTGLNINVKRTKKHKYKSRSNKTRSKRPHRNKKNKSKKRKKNKHSKKAPQRKNIGPKQNIPNTDDKVSSALPIITEEDHEDSFSDSYIPTRYDASGFFSYHTWGKDSTVRPPHEDRIVRSGPSLWHWSWDLSFGLYDDIYDNYISNKNTKNRSRSRSRNTLYLEDTWLNMEGPIPWWQPLFAAMIWFIISMYILFPVSIIAQSTPSRIDSTHLTETMATDGDRNIHISSSYAHFYVGLIFVSFELSSWITSRLSHFLIFKIGPSLMLFFGIFLMMISSILMSFTFSYSNTEFILFNILFRCIGGIGFNIVRSSTVLLWSCFAKLDMLSSGLGFCVGPVFGDLLYTYVAIDIAYIIYCVLLLLLLFILSIIIVFNLLSLQQISSVEIPNHIKNIRKPRHDIVDHDNVMNKCNKYYNYFILFFKFEIVSITIIGLTALEPTLPIYALDPLLEISVSGALFTFIYLPLLPISSLIALIFAKSSSKLIVDSPKKHVELRRRGMKYITKTLSINISDFNNFNISKSEKIKLVEGPSWLKNKKRLLPSPDISSHEFMLFCGLCILSFGTNVLSGNAMAIDIDLDSNGIDLVLGLVAISIGSSFCLISCFDSFINGLIANNPNLNQTQLTYFVINISILCGPLIGGIMLDINGNNFKKCVNYYAIIITVNACVFLSVLICKYLIKFMNHCFIQKKIKNENENEKYKNIKTQPQTNTNKVYIYGTDLRHLCWWKRGLNVRFPYVQWLESGWSATINNKQSNHSDL